MQQQAKLWEKWTFSLPGWKASKPDHREREKESLQTFIIEKYFHFNNLKYLYLFIFIYFALFYNRDVQILC